MPCLENASTYASWLTATRRVARLTGIVDIGWHGGPWCGMRMPVQKEVNMKVAPFHSKLPGTGVHHNNNQCTLGNNIESYNRVAGTGNLPLCSQCRGLN